MRSLPFTRATAEKVGDIIEFWLGVLDIASMAKGVIDVFDDHIDPTEFLNGLEKALTAFGSMARTTFTTQTTRDEDPSIALSNLLRPQR